MKLYRSLLLLCPLLLSTAGWSQENVPEKPRPPANDPIYVNDAVHATYFASIRCRGQDDPPHDATNLILVYVAAAHEMERRNPGMQPPQVKQALDARLAKVQATIDTQIDKRGCEAKDIRQLVENFNAFSKRPTNGATP